MRINSAMQNRFRSTHVSALLLASAALVLACGAWAQETPTETADTGAGITASAAPTPQYLRVTGNNVNLRTRADINSRVVDRLPRDTVLTVVGREYEWYRVQPTPNTFSLVSSRYINRSNGDRGTVQVDTSLRVRVGSAVQVRDPLLSEVQTLLETGDEVRIVGALDDEWLKIAPPEGVGFYVHQDYVESIDAAEAARLRAQGPATVAHPTPPAVKTETPTVAAPETTAQPTEQPATESRWKQRMTTVLEAIAAEEEKPDAEQKWDGFISPLKRLAAQEEDKATADLASAWVTRLERRIAAQQPKEPPAPVVKVETPTANEPIAAEHAEPTSGFDARGILRPSFAVPIGDYGLRYKLEHTTSKKVTGYVEFPTELGIDVGSLVGKYIGVRGTKLRDKQSGTTIIRVEKLTVLGGTPARPTP